MVRQLGFTSTFPEVLTSPRIPCPKHYTIVENSERIFANLCPFATILNDNKPHSFLKLQKTSRWALVCNQNSWFQEKRRKVASGNRELGKTASEVCETCLLFFNHRPGCMQQDSSVPM